jgi:hypothetical protein
MTSSHRASATKRLLAAGATTLLTAVVLVLHGPPPNGRTANAEQIPKCSGKKTQNGNACGNNVNCTNANCETWFHPEPNLAKLVPGLETDNWVGEGLTSCGNGGNCARKADGTCYYFDGSTKYTPTLVDKFECYVP